MNRVDYEYDSFTHLRRALFWDVDQPIAMLTFYADDAGKKADHDYTVVAGYIGLVAQWERFCSDWRLLLASVGLPEFHASDFFTGYGIFSGWEKRDRSQARAKLLSALAEIISDYSLHSFTCVVHTPGWLKVNEDYMLEEMGFSPFPIGGRTVAQCARQWCRDSGHDPDRVEYIFDQGSDDWGQLKNRLKNDFDIEAIDRDRRKIRPLQAADWIAYEEFREAPQSDSRIRARRFRESYRALLRVPNDPIIYREADLRSVICGAPEMKIPARSEQGKRPFALSMTTLECLALVGVTNDSPKPCRDFRPVCVSAMLRS